MPFILTAILLVVSLFSNSQTLQQLLYEGPPVFHGPKVTGNYPGTDFLFTVPATGKRPITFSCENLPAGLSLDANTGIIRGVVREKGSYAVKIFAVNALGRAEQILHIEIGDKLCLTPPLGWNSWNVFAKNIDEKMLKEMADAMVSTGMRDLGYQYLNIDDHWHAPTRDSSGNPVADPQKFPNGIEHLANYLHERGLKLGIYSDAGDKTCGKCFGSYGFEETDAAAYARWKVDLLKYDFCFVPWKKSEALKRYNKMGNALKNSGRSIAYSICNWGLFGPWNWAADAGGNYWRTTPDIFDMWKGGNPFMMSVMKIIKRNNRHAAAAGPGHWNDPDMLLVGNYGKGNATSWGGKFKGLTDTEYRSHMSVWAIMAAPLLSSCDLRCMNEATKTILMNPALLAINQDEKGEQGILITKQNGLWVFKKNLADGRTAFVLLNTANREKDYTITTQVLQQPAALTCTDVWNNSTVELKKPYALKLAAHDCAVWISR